LHAATPLAKRDEHYSRGLQSQPASPKLFGSLPVCMVLQRKAACACGGGCPSCTKVESPKTIQAKLRVSTPNELAVSQPGDTLEVEADRVANQIMGMSEPRLHQDENGPDVKRMSEPTPIDSKHSVPKHFVTDLGSGQPLDLATRGFMEPRFGRDFSEVRVHTDEHAAESAQAVNALAYTLGSDIVFARHQFSPHTAAGKQLLAHELTHVAQQRSGLQQVIQRRGESPRCPMIGVPPTAATPTQRNAGYCNAFNCHPTNPWLHCACNVSSCIPLAITALRGQGWRGDLYYWHLDQIVSAAGHTGGIYKNLARDKANFYEDVNECFYNNWRLGYAHMYEVGTSPNPAWNTAKTACPIGGENTRGCSDAQVVAEWSPVGCGTGRRALPRPSPLPRGPVRRARRAPAQPVTHRTAARWHGGPPAPRPRRDRAG